MIQPWRAIEEEVERALGTAGVESPAVEARWILERASRLRAAELSEAPATALAMAHARSMTTRRAAGEPLQYVLGEWSFRGLDLFVDSRVLIPRPETETTAQVAIEVSLPTGRITVADLGTGSGAIALALAVELPEAAVWATDVSAEALAVARANLASIGSAATRVRLAEGSWFEALPQDLEGHLRVVVANPPYVTDAEFDELPCEVRAHEPRVALVSGPTGLEAIERIISNAPRWLEPHGALVVEIAPHQAEAARDIARAAGFDDLSVRSDLTGRERVLLARIQ